MGHAEFLAPLFTGRVEVNTDNHVSTSQFTTLQNIQANTTQTKNDAVGSLFCLGSG